MKGTSSFNESRLLAMKLNAHVFSSEHPMMDDGCVDCVGSVCCACLWSVDCLTVFVLFGHLSDNMFFEMEK